MKADVPLALHAGECHPPLSAPNASAPRTGDSTGLCFHCPFHFKQLP